MCILCDAKSMIRCATGTPPRAVKSNKQIPIISKLVSTSSLAPKSSMFNTTCYCILLIILGFYCGQAEALPSFLDPVKGQTLSEEILCYSIPYGGIGFGSHLLTYYTVACLWNGRRPLMPWRHLKHTVRNCFLNAISFILAVGLGAFTLIRCRNRWQFALIAVWKISLSSTLTLSAITASIICKPKGRFWDYEMFKFRDDCPNREHVSKAAWWLVLYVLGLIVGMVGVLSLVTETWDENHTIHIITYAFLGACGPIVIVIGGSVCVNAIDDDAGCVKFSAGWPLGGVVGIVVLGVFYSDWILGAISGDLSGAPSSDNMYLYWAYFIVKRLPLASF